MVSGVTHLGSPRRGWRIRYGRYGPACSGFAAPAGNVTPVAGNDGGNGKRSRGAVERVPLSNAERQARFKARRREEAAKAEREAAVYRWAPFEAENTAAVKHGIHSARMVVPLAEQILAERRADPTWPEFLNQPVYAAAVNAWARAEAMVALYTEYIAQQTPEEMSTEFGQAEEDITGDGVKGGDSTRRSRTRKTGPSLEQWRKLEQHASLLRTKLGLDPLARARLGKDIASSQADMAQVMAQLAREDQAAS